jgi:hypothetical protein
MVEVNSAGRLKLTETPAKGERWDPIGKSLCHHLYP